MVFQEFEQDTQNKIRKLLEKGDFRAAKVIYDDEQNNLRFLKEKNKSFSKKTSKFSDG